MAPRHSSTRHKERKRRTDRADVSRTSGGEFDGHTSTGGTSQYEDNEPPVWSGAPAEASYTATVETDNGTTYSSSYNVPSTAVTMPDETPTLYPFYQSHAGGQGHDAGLTLPNHLTYYLNHNYSAVQQEPPALTAEAIEAHNNNLAAQSYHNNVVTWSQVQYRPGESMTTMTMMPQTSVIVHASSTVPSSDTMVSALAFPASRVESMAEDLCGAGVQFNDQVAPPTGHDLANENFYANP